MRKDSLTGVFLYKFRLYGSFTKKACENEQSFPHAFYDLYLFFKTLYSPTIMRPLNRADHAQVILIQHQIGVILIMYSVRCMDADAHQVIVAVQPDNLRNQLSF